MIKRVWNSDKFNLAVLIGVLAFIYAYYRVNGLMTFGFGNQPSLVRETLGKYFDYSIGPPFVYRCLIPTVGLILLKITTASPFMIVSVLEWLGATLAFVFFALLVIDRTKSVAMATLGSFALFASLCLTSLLPRYIPYFYPYDTWGLVTTMVLLWLYFTGRTRWLWFGVIVGTLIRETAIFVPLFAFLDQPKTRANVLRAAGYAATWLAVRLVVTRVIFPEGTPFQHQWPENIKFFITEGSGWRYLIFGATIGFNFLLLGRLARREAALYGPYFALAVIYAGGMFYVANWFEYRVFTELTPFILLPLLVSQFRAINGARGDASRH